MNWSVYNDFFWLEEVRFCWISRFLMVGTVKPFTYPDSLIRLLFPLSYRQLEGLTRGLSKYVEGLAAPDYTTLNKRTIGSTKHRRGLN